MPQSGRFIKALFYGIIFIHDFYNSLSSGLVYCNNRQSTVVVIEVQDRQTSSSPLDPFDDGGGGSRGEVRVLVGFLDERDAVAEEAFEEFCS